MGNVAHFRFRKCAKPVNENSRPVIVNSMLPPIGAVFFNRVEKVPNNFPFAKVISRAT